MYLSIRHSHLRLSQGHLFWREVGSQTHPTLVFLHGSWHDSSQWLPIIQRLGEQYHCLVPDLLGFGESERPPIHYSIDLMASCLAEYLKTLKQKQVYFIGHSLGGWVAARFALKYPEIVRGLVLVSPEGVQVEDHKQRWKQMRSLLGPPAFLLWGLQLIYPLARLFGKHHSIEGLFQLRRAMIHYPTATQLLVKRRWPEYQAELLDDQLPLLKLPLLILQGTHDHPRSLVLSETYNTLAPQGELRFIQQGNHQLPETEPELVANVLGEFIETHRG